MNALTVIPDYAPAIKLVLDSLTSPHSKRTYGSALNGFFAWWEAQGKPQFSRATVQAYRTHLETKGKSSSAINLAMASLRALAREARFAGLLDSTLAEGIAAVHGAKRSPLRPANWLDRSAANALLAMPDTATLKGRRDRVLLGLLLCSGLRRDEAARLEVADVQERDGRPVLAIVGKGRKSRLVCIPHALRQAITEWMTAAGFTEGRVLRSVNKADRIDGTGLTGSAIHRIVGAYAKDMGVKLAPHDCRRTLAKLARKGGCEYDQIKAEYGHSSVATTEGYVGDVQDFSRGACDYAGLVL